MSSQLLTKVRIQTFGLRILTDSYSVISAMKTERGLALQDLITGAYEFIEGIDLKPAARIYLLDHLATTEYVQL